MICRNLAVYWRSGTNGTFLHASGIVLDRAAFLFVGPRGAGKTTVLLESTLRMGAQPLSNDRVHVSADDAPIARSWPGYLTLFEGTMLRHPRLLEAARRYELDESFRTASWPDEPTASFDRADKRIYPMQWFSTALGRRYVASAPLGALVLLSSAAAGQPSHCEPLDLGISATREAVIAVLNTESFDHEEDDFLAWHGLPLPSDAPTARSLVQRLHTAGVRIYGLRVARDDDLGLASLLGCSEAERDAKRRGAQR